MLAALGDWSAYGAAKFYCATDPSDSSASAEIAARISRMTALMSSASAGMPRYAVAGIAGERHEGVASRLVVKRPSMRLFTGLSEGKNAAHSPWGPKNCTTQGSFEDFARDRFIIGDKASVNAEIMRYREHSNAAAELGLADYSRQAWARPTFLVVTMTPSSWPQPTARVLDPHRILPFV